ncbi:MAG: MotA/TolQ/ExbB proton channel family protein [Alphaproteobacteria bacterium]
MFEQFNDFIQMSGSIGYILTGFAVLSVIIVLYKVYEFIYTGVIPTSIGRNKPMQYFSSAKTKAEIEEKEDEYVLSHQHGFLFLSITITVAPMLGLLGTVIGMIDAFQTMSALGDAVNVASLASGIWKALITTAAGLSVAICVLIASNILQSILEKHIAKLSAQLKK